MRTVIAGVVLSTITALSAQGGDADAVMAQMRQALGGAAALDAVQCFSGSGTNTTRGGGINHSLPFEMFALLPDHYMTVRRDWRPGGPLPVEITYYNGFRGDELIRRTDSNIPFPPDPGSQTPAAIAQRRRDQTLKNKQDFARLALVLFGRSLISYPLVFSQAESETIDGRACDAIEARHVDGFTVKLFVDAATHLPVMVSWQGPAIVRFTTSSSSVVATSSRGDSKVLSHTPPTVPSVDPSGVPVVEHRVVFAEYKLQDGFNWPRSLKHVVGGEVFEETKLGKFKINPNLKPGKFDIR